MSLTDSCPIGPPADPRRAGEPVGARPGAPGPARQSGGPAWRRRERQLVGELPEGLDRLAADLRSGAALPAALATLAQGDDHLAREISTLLERTAGGVPLAVVLDDWSGRAEGTIAVATGALSVAASTGGRSADALEGLAAGLRDDRRLHDEVKALSAQGRLSAVVVGLAPLGALALSLVADPRVPAALLGTPTGRTCLVSGLALEAVAAWWMARILRLPWRHPAGSDGRPSGGRRSGGRVARCRVGVGQPVEAVLPLTADLLAMALGAGLTPFEAITIAARAAPPAAARNLDDVLVSVATGRRLVRALEEKSVGAMRPLLQILLVSERDGAPVAPALGRLAADGRERIRCAALARAHTIPVRLLFPLVFLVLPAFLLLTVAPVLLVGISGGATHLEV